MIYSYLYAPSLCDSWISIKAHNKAITHLKSIVNVFLGVKYSIITPAMNVEITVMAKMEDCIN